MFPFAGVPCGVPIFDPEPFLALKSGSIALPISAESGRAASHQAIAVLGQMRSEQAAGTSSNTPPTRNVRFHVSWWEGNLAVGQNQWYHSGVGEITTHFRTYLSGGWDVHWVYRILTHGHLCLCFADALGWGCCKGNPTVHEFDFFLWAHVKKTSRKRVPSFRAAPELGLRSFQLIALLISIRSFGHMGEKRAVPLCGHFD